MRYRARLKGAFDVVIDQTNTIPFFTPMWAGIPVFLMIWQLAREVWWYESRFPLNVIGYTLEPIYLRTYRRTPVLTFSKSTENDLLAIGLHGEITVVPVGIEQGAVPAEPKSNEPTFIYVGRIAPSKRVHDIVRAFAIFRNARGNGRLVLIGTGPNTYTQRIVRLSVALGVSDSVELSGWLEGQAKRRRMAEAHALLMASAREGWGLVVTECNACGTPAIVYDVPGLRDSTRHLQTGLVVQPNPSRLAAAMLDLVHDSELYGRLRAQALSWSRTLTFDEACRVLSMALERTPPPSMSPPRN